jgi:MoxR-like ATPase
MGPENGMAGALLGKPGTGKSLLLEHGHKIISGIEPESVAKIPHTMDLQPGKLTGETTELIRTITDEEFAFSPDDSKQEARQKTEKLKAELIPLIHRGIKVLKFDEITRTSPYALNAALEIMQDGKITVYENGVAKQMDAFELVVSNTNNFGTLFTNPLDPAVIARHGMGAITGERKPGELTEAGIVQFRNPNRRFDIVKDVPTAISLNGLRKIRSMVEHVPVGSAEQDFGIELHTKMLDMLVQRGIDLGDGRSVPQTIRISQALAMLDGSKDWVTKDHLLEAHQYFATAKLGLIGRYKQDEINTDIQSLA